MKEKILKYIVIILSIFFFVMGMFYIKKAYGDEYLNSYQTNCFYEQDLEYYTIDMAFADMPIYQIQALAYDDCKTHQQKYQFHKENASRCYKNASEKCWWLPDIDYREKARYCLINIGALLTAGNPQSKVITVIVTTLVQYGIDCCDEWNYIETQLKWSKYHYEMMEFFDDVIKQANVSGKNNNQANNNQGVKYVVPMKNAVLPIPYNHHKKKKS